MNNKQAKTVITFGTFDLLHPGHHYYLNQAKNLGTNLVVIIARDQTVFQVKGFLPVENETIRLKNVQQTKIADKVILGSTKNKYQVLLDHKPDIIALGYDQIAFTNNLNKVIIELGLKSKIIRLDSFHPDKFKSSVLKNQLKSNESTQRKPSKFKEE